MGGAVAAMRPTTPAAILGALLFGLSSAGAATLEGSVTVEGRPAAHAVVYLEGLGATEPPAIPGRVIMDQKNLAFVPGVLPVMRGTVIEFTNSDDVQHNVFSPSAIAGKFNLGTYGPGAIRTVTLDQPGDVRVLCNIHMEMEAHILVLNGPSFATAAEDGTYRIPDVPAGTYAVKVWHDHWRAVERTLDVPATGHLNVDITVGK